MAAGVRYAVTERGLWTSSAVTLMNAHAAGCAGNVGRQIIRTSVRIQPELFAQNAGRKMPMRISSTTSS